MSFHKHTDVIKLNTNNVFNNLNNKNVIPSKYILVFDISNKNKMCKMVKINISKYKFILTIYTSRFYLNIRYQDVLARNYIFIIYVEIIRWQRFLLTTSSKNVCSWREALGNTYTYKTIFWIISLIQN